MKATNLSAKRELNNVLKEEYKSFSALCKVIEAKKESQAMKAYLNESSLEFNQIVNFDYIKKGLNLHVFTSSDGKTTYETICRKTKEGEIIPAKWSFWLILTAAAKVRKEEIKVAQRAAKEAKEKSLQDIKIEEKKETKKVTKKAIKEIKNVA